MQIEKIVNGIQRVGPQAGMVSTIVKFGDERIMSPVDIVRAARLGRSRKVLLELPDLTKDKNHLVILCKLLTKSRKFVVLHTVSNRYSPELIPFVSLWRLRIPISEDGPELDNVLTRYMELVKRNRLSFEIVTCGDFFIMRSLVARLGLAGFDLTLIPCPHSPNPYYTLLSNIQQDRFWTSMDSLRLLPSFGEIHGETKAGFLACEKASVNSRINPDDCLGGEPS